MNSADKIKILFLAADPSDAARLRIGEELREIRERLQLAKERDKFVLESRESVRPGDISQAIFDVEPQIVHFSGHGTGTGELCFEDLLGKYQPVKSEALAALFELVADRINCVLLNACDSEAQAKAIAEHIPFVIGMNKAIGDKAAIAFAVGFYKALAAGQTIDKAYKFGCVEIRLQGISEHLTPVLHTKQSPVSQVTEIQQIVSNKTMTINPRQKQRLQQQLETLQAEWNLRHKKLTRIQEALAIETSVTIKFQLEQQRHDEEAQLESLANELDKIEQILQ
ncbi:CHAT domain-containing protein [Dendronalium sp. ChiSLP03b]|uniref:CHAT domain-containing protein n=1 Tax=Dendronalium sp. ChiSLP03b TaxID=3075381 RepID=UPI002AD30E9D|nr:CHAT domain-containing protein [Dendronalium sp. ChiSLP03b]MDZ8207642.1 CHAT domain-containing protein [Dendronalium sp. ChiSLP03b]